MVETADAEKLARAIKNIEVRMREIRSKDTYQQQVGHATQLGFAVELDADTILAALRRVAEPVEVRRIETVAGDFLTEPGRPFWRIEINSFCADFDYREAAENFAAQINARAAIAGDDRVARLSGALKRIADGDEPRPLGLSWADGKTSKNDKCVHGRYMYEDCGVCVADFARAALEDTRDGN